MKNSPQEYGQIVSFTKDTPIVYPDFTLTYTGCFPISTDPNVSMFMVDKFEINIEGPQISQTLYIQTRWTKLGPTYPEPFHVYRKTFQLKFGSEKMSTIVDPVTGPDTKNSLLPGQLVVTEIKKPKHVYIAVLETGGYAVGFYYPYQASSTDENTVWYLYENGVLEEDGTADVECPGDICAGTVHFKEISLKGETFLYEDFLEKNKTLPVYSGLVSEIERVLKLND